MSSRLEGKVRVIAGMGGSIGRASALAFAREGKSVVGCHLGVDAPRDTVELVRGSVRNMVSKHPCHLTDPTDCPGGGRVGARQLRPGRRAVQPHASADFNRLEDSVDDGSSHVLVRRLPGWRGWPEEVAKVAPFLASEDSSYATVAEILVDGGMNVWSLLV